MSQHTLKGRSAKNFVDKMKNHGMPILKTKKNNIDRHHK